MSSCIPGLILVLIDAFFINLPFTPSGLESKIDWRGKDQKLSIFSTFLSSKDKNGKDQLRRPEVTHGGKYEKKLNTNYFGPLKIRVKYQHYGKHWDTHSSNWSTIIMDSTDLADVSFLKKLLSTSIRISSCIRGKGIYKANVWALWCFDWADSSIMGWMNISDLKACSFSCKSSRT